MKILDITVAKDAKTQDVMVPPLQLSIELQKRSTTAQEETAATLQTAVNSSDIASVPDAATANTADMDDNIDVPFDDNGDIDSLIQLVKMVTSHVNS